MLQFINFDSSLLSTDHHISSQVTCSLLLAMKVCACTLLT